jgi:opacity protein-like surface antigen
MVSVKSFIAAAAAIIVSTAAVYAADMPAPPPEIVYQPVPCCATGGWYLRGDIGIGVQTFSEFDFTQTNSAFVWPSNWQIVQKNVQDTAIFGFGVGYEVNNWLRVDVTGEYRTEAAFKATGSYSGAANFCNLPSGVGTCFDVNTGNISSSVFMANAYVDLGTWWCLTPFIGAGVGGAYNRITGVQDNGIIPVGSGGFGYTLNDASAWTLAWNVQAGLTYNVNNNLKIDFSWRWLNLGSPQTAIVQCQNTPACPSAFYTLRDMTSQDFRIGFRWMIQPTAGVGVLAAQPVFAPQPAYEPPPVYAPQPPLSSRG